MASTQAGAASGKAGKFQHLQLRSLLDEPFWPPDATWRAMGFGHAEERVDVPVLLALPSSERSEDALLGACEALAQVLAGERGLEELCTCFGWPGGAEYFAALGETQVMLVDTDHNDLDDRLAIVLLAFQMASANAQRRAESPSSRCRLLLDARTYETRGGLTLHRTLRLAARLHVLLFTPHGLAVEVLLSDSARALTLVAGHLGVEPAHAAVNEAAAGVGDALLGDGPGCCRASLRECLGDGARAAIWLLSGVCAKQAADLEECSSLPRAHFVIFEQAQPAWQSVEVDPDAREQPAWSFPPAVGDERGFGAEPSNVRSSEEPYGATLAAYLRMQRAVAAAPDRFAYVAPALARSAGSMPVPPGQPLRWVSGRPLNVVVGESYVVKKACDVDRAQRVFSSLLAAARAHSPDALDRELRTGTLDDAGSERRYIHMCMYVYDYLRLSLLSLLSVLSLSLLLL